MQETKSENLYVTLKKEELDELMKDAASIGAQAALDKIDQERKGFLKKMRNKKLHNTKLLLRNFHMLKENADHSIFGKSQLEESAADILSNMMNLYDDEVIVDAIKRSTTRTAIIVAHIETMLNIYDAYCYKSSNLLDRRRHDVLFEMYIADKRLTAMEIAKNRNMSKENVYSDLRIAVEKLSALIFGIDGLKIK